MFGKRNYKKSPTFRPENGLVLVLKNALKWLQLKWYTVGYGIHLTIRMLHDKTYEKIPAYKNYSDKKYTSSVHKAVLTAFIASFAIFLAFQTLIPSLFRPNSVRAATSNILWSSTADFGAGQSPAVTNDGNLDIGTHSGDDGNGSIKLKQAASYGSAEDGSFVLTGIGTMPKVYRNGATTPILTTTFNLNTDTLGQNSARGANQKQPDGVASYATGTGVNGGDATLTGVANIVGFTAGDEILVARFWQSGDATNGTYLTLSETKTITNVATGTITVGGLLANTYSTGKITIQRIPHYGVVNIPGGITLTANGYNVTNGTGGVIQFKSNNLVENDGVISATGLGYGYGSGPGPGGNTYATNTFCVNGYFNADGAGGGGYGANGGGGGHDSVNNGGRTPGAAGIGYSSSFDFGSGGGSDYIDTNWCNDLGHLAGAGGVGGGAISVTSNGGILNYGSISSNGTAGANSNAGNMVGSGGGAGGGSINLLTSGSVTTNSTSSVTANGGTGGAGSADTAGYNFVAPSGGGAAGRIIIKSVSQTINGTLTQNGGAAGAPNGDPGVAGAGSNNNTATWTAFVPYVVAGNLGTSGVGLRKDVSPSTAKWKDLQVKGNIPAGTTVQFQVRYSDTFGSGNFVNPATYTQTNTWSTAITPGDYSASGTTILLDTNMPLSKTLEVIMLMGGGSSTPRIDSIQLDYDSLNAPAGPAQYKSDGVTLISSGGWTNETGMALKADIPDLTPIPTSGETLTPQLELVTGSSPTFTGSPTTFPTGAVSFSANTPSYTGAAVGVNFGTLSGLTAGTTYNWKIRFTDQAGRIGPWSATFQTVNIDQTAPTVTVSFSSTYTLSTAVSVNITAADSGGSNLGKLYLSNDGTNWTDSTPASSFTGTASYSGSVSWTLPSGDGAKNVYAKVTDNATNTSGWIQTSDADFNAGLTKTNTVINSGAISLSSGWFQGQAETGYPTSLLGKFINTVDLGGRYQWATSGVSCVGPQCSNTIAPAPDPDIPSKMVLVDPVKNNTVGFTAYPAQAACAAIGKGSRLPTTNELKAISVGRSHYGNNFVPNVSGNDAYWSATEYDAGNSYIAQPSTGSTGVKGKTEAWYVRCIADQSPTFAASGTFESSIYDYGSTGSAYGVVNYGSEQPAGTSVAVFARGGNTATPDGSWTSYTAALTSGISSLSSLNGNRYLQYKVVLTGGANTPKFNDVSIQVLPGALINLDSTLPNAFSLATLADGTWQGSNAPTLSWNGTSDAGSGVAKYELCVDARSCQNVGLSLSVAVSPAVTEGTHTWYVKATDNAGNVRNSTETWTFGYDATLPAAPQSFTITNGVNDLNLLWSFANNTGSPIATIKVERIDWGNYNPVDAGADWSLYSSYHNKTYAGATNGVTYSVSDIDPDTKIVQGKKYAYRISGKDSVNAGYGAYSGVAAGLTQDSIFDASVLSVAVAPCDGTNNCSVNPNISHKGHEVKITWGPASDSGVGTSHYLIYRSTQDLNSGNYSDPGVRAGYQIVGVLPYQLGQSPVWYDNDANNAGTTAFVDGNGNPITISAGIQALTTKTVATSALSDYSLYYYRVVGVDLNNNKSPLFAESVDASTYDVLKAHQNGNVGVDAERTPDVTAPSIPSSVSVVATGIDDLNSTPDPTQGISISWNFATDNSGRAVTYKLYKSQGDVNGPGAWGGSPIYAGTNTSYQEKGLAQNTFYYYKVTAEDPSANVSGFSDYSGAQTKNSQAPTTPTYVTVRATKGNPAQNTNVGHEISIQFNGSTIRYSTNKVTGYEVYRSNANYATEAEWLVSATKVKTFNGINYAGYDGSIEYDVTHSFTETVPADATTYYYRVRAIGQNSDGVVESGLSAIQVATLNYGWDTTPDVSAPNLPAEVKIKDIHDDGMNYKRNIVTWARIANPLRLGQNDFSEYRIYRSNDGLVWQQICQNGLEANGCSALDPNPLAGATKDLALANNYYIDLIPISQANQYYYYYVTAIDDAGSAFKYPNGIIINGYSNESQPLRDAGNNIQAVSLNPATTQPSIENQTGGLKAALTSVGVATATVSWTTDQPCDSMVEFRKAGSSDAYKQIGVGDSSRNLGMTKTHTVNLFGLLPSTNYEYIIVSRNFLSNAVVAEGADLPNLTTSGFTITNVASTSTTTTAVITWQTNIQADGNYVEYQMQRLPGDDNIGGTGGEDMSPVLDPSTQQLRTNLTQTEINTYLINHKVVLGGLKSARTYSFKIRSVSTDGFVTYSNLGSFNTRNFDTSQFSLAPSSSNIADRNINSTTAQIVWQTSVPTTSWIEYGTSTGVYGTSAGDNNLNTTHVVTITGLVPGTKYFYRARVKDANDVEYTSPEYNFTAVIKPKISNMQVREVTPYSVTISWETNVDTETVLNWGKTGAYGEKHGTGGTSQVHQVKIEGLDDNTEYHYQIVAHDSAGNEVVGSDAIVRTPLDTEGPKITNVKTDIMPLGDSDTTAQVIVSWTTNKPATTKVEYDEGIIGGKYTKASTEDTSLNTSHTVIIKGLNVATTYHYRIVTKDKRGNVTTSNDYTFVTPSKEQSIWQLIVKSLQDTFAWTQNLGKLFKRK